MRHTSDGTAKRLYCMCGGFLTFDQSVFTHMQGMGTLVEVPTLMFLIEHLEGLVVLETGLHPALAVDPRLTGARAPRSGSPACDPSNSSSDSSSE